MTSTNNHQLPKLRALDAQPAAQNGRRMLVLRDPLQISDKVVAIPLELAPILMLCDGTRDSGGLLASLEVRFGIRATPAIVERFLDVCDQALLLDNDHYRLAQERLLAEYRAGLYREPSLAGLSYAADAEGLAREFEGYAREREKRDQRLEIGDWRLAAPQSPISSLQYPTAVISPHIDYQRGGPVYAGTWRAAKQAVREADLVIAFGTDHYGGLGDLTLTRQSYATPFGVLPNPAEIVDALAQAIGPERAFANELHHRSEHSIELAMNWLAYVRHQLGQKQIPVLPILCGSFHHFVAGQARPEQDRGITGLLHTLQEHTAGQRVLVVAGADLAHVGPAFGGEPQGATECARVEAADREIIERIAAGDARGFFEAVRGVGDRFNVCGLSPIYLTLRYLAMCRDGGDTGISPGPAQGRLIGYDKCPADDAGTSFVSVCGVII